MTTKKTSKAAPKTVEKTVKIKYQGRTIQLLESEYLSAKNYYGDNYPAELISE